MTVVALNDTQISAGLKSPYKLSTAQFTYSIAVAGSTWPDYAGGTQPSGAGYGVLTAGQAAAFRAAILAWDRFVAPNFTEVTEPGSVGEVRVAFTDYDMTPSTGGYAFQGSNQTPTSVVGDIWINSSLAAQSFDQGTDNYNIFLHEIGHTLGLKHPFEPTVIPAPYENQRYTVMSYTTATPTFTLEFNITPGSIGTTSRRAIVTTPMVLDIAAVQSLYGADTTTAATDTTYSFTQGDTTIQTIYDAGGTDTIDLSSFTRNNVVDLRPGSYSSVGFWTEAEQQAYWQAQTSEPTFDTFIADQYTARDAYEWRDNLGISFSTTIENVTTGSGADTITGNSAANVIDGGAGADTMAGGAGDDTYYVDNAGDIVTEAAGEGTDTVRTSLASYTLTANVERLYAMGGGASTFIGTNDGEIFVLSDGGNDNVSGGGGDDGFVFGATLTAADVVDGGDGTLDQVGLQGNYAGLTLGAGNLTNVEFLVFMSGSDTRFGDTANNFYDYNVTSVDANVGANQRLVVSGNALRAGEDMTFNGAAETDGYFLTYGGRGVDTITGGSQTDGFYFGPSTFGAGDVINGGPGTLDQIGLQGDFTIAFGAGQLIGVEIVVLVAGADTRFGGGGAVSYDYNITMNDGNVGVGGTMAISGNRLAADETLTLNASAEANATYRVFAGAGADVITTGGGADEIFGGGSADTLTGGGGNDTFAYVSVTDSNSTQRDGIQDFTLGDVIDLSRIDANSGLGGDQAFNFIGTAAFSGAAGELRFSNVAGAIWLVAGDTDGNSSSDFEVIVVVADGNPITSSDFIL